MKKVFLFIFACMFLSAPVIAADPPKAVNNDNIMKMDSNNDGKTTIDDIYKNRTDDLDTKDADKDKKVTKEEFLANIQTTFNNIDGNKDKVIDSVEFVEYRCGELKGKKLPASSNKSPKNDKSPMVKQMDKNKDGVIDDVECIEFWTAKFNNMDINKDGKISSGEYNQFMSAAFVRNDGPDKDGIITIEEYRINWFGKTPQDNKKAPEKTTAPAVK